MYSIVFKKSAAKELKKLQRKQQIVILQKIMQLESDPNPSGCKKLVGQNSAFRIRVGDYRVVYSVFNKQLIIEIIRIKHRKEVYK